VILSGIFNCASCRQRACQIEDKHTQLEYVVRGDQADNPGAGVPELAFINEVARGKDTENQTALSG